MTPRQALLHFVIAAVAGFPVFLIVAHWGRAPGPVTWAISFTALWGLVSVWLRAARVNDEYHETVLRPGHRN